MVNPPANSVGLQFAPEVRAEVEVGGAKNLEVINPGIASMDLGHQDIDSPSKAIGCWWAAQLLVSETGSLTVDDALKKIGQSPDLPKIRLFGQKLAEIVERDGLSKVDANLGPDPALQEAVQHAGLDRSLFYYMVGKAASIKENRATGQQIVVAKAHLLGSNRRVWPPNPDAQGNLEERQAA